MKIELDWITPNAEAIIEKKGRICWQSVKGENDEDGNLIHKLIKMGHDPNKSEREIMEQLGYHRIYDSGNLKFIYKNDV